MQCRNLASHKHQKVPSIKFKQHDITDCGAACLASISAHYQLQLPIARIRQYAGTDKKGTNVLGLVEAARKLGFETKGVRADLESLFHIPKPAIAHVVVNKVLQHYVVLLDIRPKWVKVMDPADGKIHKIPHRNFNKEWTGVLVLLEPAESFTPGDSRISVYRRFWHLLKPHKWVLLQALIGAFLYTLLGFSTSIYIQKLTDFIFINGNTRLLNLLSIIMLVLLVLQLVLGWYKDVFLLRTGQQIDARLILGYYKHLLSLPQHFFDTMRIGEILSRINDAVKIRHFINGVSLNLTVNVLIVVFSFLLMFSFYWKLAVIMLAVIPLYLVLYVVINRLNRKTERKVMERSAELESQLVESLKSIRTIKQFRLEDFTNIKTETRFIALLNTGYTSALNGLFSISSTRMAAALITILLLWSGTHFVIRKELSPGELMSFYAIVAYFTGPVASLIGANREIQNALIAADRLFEIMDLEIENSQQTIRFKQDHLGPIIFRDVSFRYGTRKEVFNDLNITIPRGKITAVIGESGSGKSTLIALLQNLYPLQKGNILIGKHDLRYLEPDSLRQMISVVPQQIDLFAGSVIANIAVGDFNPDMDRILAICTSLGMLNFIEALPNGFHTYLGGNGASLSGGEKQRLAMARALYREPEILLLDEASSSLDSSAERHIQKVIHQLRESGKTVLLIAHRLSTVRFADLIIVLEQGQVIEQGSHESLYEKQGQYYHYWQQQIPERPAEQLLHAK